MSYRAPAGPMICSHCGARRTRLLNIEWVYVLPDVRPPPRGSDTQAGAWAAHKQIHGLPAQYVAGMRAEGS
jgi:hypothetical protein